MKFLLLLIAVFVLFWLLRGSWRRTRRPPPPPPSAKPAEADEPQPMLSCAHCGLHLPRDESLPGRGGVFCGAAHREAFERAHPES